MWHVFRNVAELVWKPCQKGNAWPLVLQAVSSLVWFFSRNCSDVMLLIFSGRDTNSSCLAQCHEWLLKSILAVRDISLVELILVCKVSLNTRIRHWPSAANPLPTAVIPSCPLFIDWIGTGTVQMTIHLKTGSNCTDESTQIGIIWLQRGKCCIFHPKGGGLKPKPCLGSLLFPKSQESALLYSSPTL